jgi:CRISPR/Cas system CMR-associated protein Cmr5 small subunit
MKTYSICYQIKSHILENGLKPVVFFISSLVQSIHLLLFNILEKPVFKI